MDYLPIFVDLKDRSCLVVGGGDSAIEEGVFLTRYANSVTIIHRRDELRAGPILQKRAMENPKMKFIWNSIVSEIIGTESVHSVQLQDVVTGKQTDHGIEGVFIFIGHTPNTQIFQDQLEMDETGYLVVDQLMQTSIPGVYAAGEVADHNFRQVITSAGMGAGAAIQIRHFLDELSDN